MILVFRVHDELGLDEIGVAVEVAPDELGPPWPGVVVYRRRVEGHDAAPGLIPVLELFALFFVKRITDVGGAVEDHGLIEVQPGKILR